MNTLSSLSAFRCPNNETVWKVRTLSCLVFLGGWKSVQQLLSLRQAMLFASNLTPSYSTLQREGAASTSVWIGTRLMKEVFNGCSFWYLAFRLLNSLIMSPSFQQHMTTSWPTLFPPWWWWLMPFIKNLFTWHLQPWPMNCSIRFSSITILLVLYFVAPRQRFVCFPSCYVS